MCSLAKIPPSIIGAIPVDVIDKTRRPSPRNKEPNKSVRAIVFLVDSYDDIPVTVRTRFGPCRFVPSFDAPDKMASVRNILNNFA